MSKAFIFDMDGVLVDSERAWGEEEQLLLEEMFGSDIARDVNQTLGVSIGTTFEKAKTMGESISYEAYLKRYDAAALKILARAEITPKTDTLVARLKARGYRIGLVSSSPRAWIDKVLSRLTFSGAFDHVESLFEHPELDPKPAPDGYLDACRELGVAPEDTVVLEDSNPGITAAKAAGCFVIGFRGALPALYEQIGADAYADTMEKVIDIVTSFDDH
ncbi:hypothetical protein A3C21_00845 [Candidatus Kaiserbacteria bacterium RIFCSPHIGHO2_02_FULL_59_21]|uniref:Hydrolase n=1 Tax=Candidatus Kaiserbacteria bacterium RIFCSPHIGHO2_02_FULL_59_21 TaxID=1798500 RepID=A0A1F6E265_9BACT|nr:MAG: hypothetical protein A3C21_00845 [Candidatus Kaiserbacteria bacterium RIFCSPHIGHO2_02_FULL_59_21]OGG86559.1 MAG: hypothetical protein A3I47_02660 [Candidatus Kaiserbacteria bacterium RIFCSPLOWO2_02_FULL_59_19]